MSIFSKTDFQLCFVPVPKGYPQSQTHVGVYLYKNKVYLSSSPFPIVKYGNFVAYTRAIVRKISHGKICKLVVGESFENPLLYVSTENSNIVFRLMQSKPLMEQPDPYYGYPSFNSDPDLFIENNTIYVINRSIFRTKLTPNRKRDEYIIRYYLIKGLIDENRFKFISSNLIYESDELTVSPCLTKYRGKYILTNLYTNCYNDGENFEGLKYVSADSIESVTSKRDWKTIEVDTSIFIPWHMSLFVYNDELFTIVACVRRGESHRCYQLLGKFKDDLSALDIFNTPLCDYNSYRGSAYVSADGVFHLYNATVNEKIKGGESVDGREIIYSSMPFSKLLKQIKG